jgi:hypothetical protein
MEENIENTEEVVENTYTNHSGESIKVDTLETTHLTNAMAKKMREVFEATTKDEAYSKMKEVRALKEEAFKRINVFIEGLGDEDE